MLWDMLTLMSGAAAVGAALAAGHRNVSSWIVGLALGIVCICAVRMVGERVIRRLESSPNGRPVSESAYRALYLGALLWVVVSAVLGFWIMRLVVYYVAA